MKTHIEQGVEEPPNSHIQEKHFPRAKRIKTIDWDLRYEYVVCVSCAMHATKTYGFGLSAEKRVCD